MSGCWSGVANLILRFQLRPHCVCNWKRSDDEVGCCKRIRVDLAEKFRNIYVGYLHGSWIQFPDGFVLAEVDDAVIL